MFISIWCLLLCLVLWFLFWVFRISQTIIYDESNKAIVLLYMVGTVLEVIMVFFLVINNIVTYESCQLDIPQCIIHKEQILNKKAADLTERDNLCIEYFKEVKWEKATKYD